MSRTRISGRPGSVGSELAFAGLMYGTRLFCAVAYCQSRRTYGFLATRFHTYSAFRSMFHGDASR
jgi:hypothetical protein